MIGAARAMGAIAKALSRVPQRCPRSRTGGPGCFKRCKLIRRCGQGLATHRPRGEFSDSHIGAMPSLDMEVPRRAPRMDDRGAGAEIAIQPPSRFAPRGGARMAAPNCNMRWRLWHETARLRVCP